MTDIQRLTAELDLAELVVPPDYNEPIGISNESLAEWLMVAGRVNGLSGQEMESTQLKYIPDTLHVLVPEFFVDPETPATAADVNIDDELEVDVMPSVTRFGYNADDNAKLAMLPANTLYTLPRGTTAEKLPGKPNTPSTLSLAGVATIFALNRPRYPCWITSLMVAVGMAMGFYQRGDDGITREWQTTTVFPTLDNMAFALSKLRGKSGAKMWKMALDLIAFLGYCRLSYTHPVDSSNASLLEQQAKSFNKIGELPEADAISAADIQGLLHGGVHGMSLGGAVGWYCLWRFNTFASPFIKARANCVGDLYKGLAITEAGYLSLISMPSLSKLSRIVANEIAEITAWLERAYLTPWVSSSLSMLLSGSPQVEYPNSLKVTLSLLGALIAAAAENSVLPPSFKSSYYVMNLKKKYAGAVAFWDTYFGAQARAMDRLTDKELAQVAADAMMALQPAPGTAADNRALVVANA